MGQGLPKPVTSAVVKRVAGPLFRVGMAEMNGWRVSMEDTHVIFMQETWGLFGVLDGHGGDQCSAFVAKRLVEELQQAKPADDDAVSRLALKLDREFLETGQPSGSTGTFVMVHPEGGRRLLRVANVGDSRILLARRDGSIVEGEGTDGGLTTDHKPDHPSERARIERTGGTVQEVMGVARVNGDLSVSRAFGDAQYKTTGEPAESDHPVSARPEFTQLECGSQDFLMLVCDGISEGEFPNREAVRVAAERLRADDDPGKAAEAVCREALRMGSKDNLSCMVVLLEGAAEASEASQLVPGPFEAPEHPGFRRAYEAMADRAGLSLAAAVELRHDVTRRAAEGTTPEPVVLRELAVFGDGPPAQLEAGSAERTAWFARWLEEHSGDQEDGEAVPLSHDQILELLEDDPKLMAMAQARGLVDAGARREVRVAPLEELKTAVEAVPNLRWEAAMGELCGQQGRVMQDDPSDGTSKVRFPGLGIVAWLPTSTLADVEPADGAGDESAQGEAASGAGAEAKAEAKAEAAEAARAPAAGPGDTAGELKPLEGDESSEKRQRTG
mmetsp:Transcript_99215/g.280945  ORF Transcript_99215/g.280945 Transcript_99215/m.280945 type:complete len:557 (-) Transcript_99215:113-1783(-)